MHEEALRGFDRQVVRIDRVQRRHHREERHACEQRESKGEGGRPRNARAPLRLTPLFAHRPPDKFAEDPGIDHSDRVSPTPRGRARGSAAAW